MQLAYLAKGLDGGHAYIVVLDTTILLLYTTWKIRSLCGLTLIIGSLALCATFYVIHMFGCHVTAIIDTLKISILTSCLMKANRILATEHS